MSFVVLLIIDTVVVMLISASSVGQDVMKKLIIFHVPELWGVGHLNLAAFYATFFGRMVVLNH